MLRSVKASFNAYARCLEQRFADEQWAVVLFGHGGHT